MGITAEYLIAVVPYIILLRKCRGHKDHTPPVAKEIADKVNEVTLAKEQYFNPAQGPITCTCISNTCT